MSDTWTCGRTPPAADTAALATFSTGTGANSATASTGKFLSKVDMGDMAIHSGSAAPPPTYLVVVAQVVYLKGIFETKF